MKRLILIGLLGLVLPLTCAAQKWTVQTNFLDWAALGTVNAEVGMSVSQHFSLMVGGRYNPWDFHTHNPEALVQNRQETAYLGVRYWTWYVNSGFWMAAKAQYMHSFSHTGIWRAALKEGRNGFGGALSLGYTFMLSKHFNLEIGAGGWAGVFQHYGFYSSPEKRFVREEGRKAFLYPDQLSLSLVYVF